MHTRSVSGRSQHSLSHILRLTSHPERGETPSRGAPPASRERRALPASRKEGHGEFPRLSHSGILSPKPGPEHTPLLPPLFRMRSPSAGPAPRDDPSTPPPPPPAAAGPPRAGLAVPAELSEDSAGPALRRAKQEAGLTLPSPHPRLAALQPRSHRASPVPASGSAAHPAGLASRALQDQGWRPRTLDRSGLELLGLPRRRLPQLPPPYLPRPTEPESRPGPDGSDVTAGTPTPGRPAQPRPPAGVGRRPGPLPGWQGAGAGRAVLRGQRVMGASWQPGFGPC